MSIVNKEDTIKRVAAKTEFTQKDVRAVINALRDVVYDEISQAGTIKPFDGVTFTGVVKPAREARNPRTGDTIQVAEKTVPRVTFGKYAKAQTNRV